MRVGRHAAEVAQAEIPPAGARNRFRRGVTLAGLKVGHPDQHIDHIFGLETKVHDKVKVGLRVSSGDTDPRSTNSTYANFFSTKDAPGSTDLVIGLSGASAKGDSSASISCSAAVFHMKGNEA